MQRNKEMMPARTRSDDDTEIATRAIEDFSDTLTADKFFELNDKPRNFFFSQASGSREIHDAVSSHGNERSHWSSAHF